MIRIYYIIVYIIIRDAFYFYIRALNLHLEKIFDIGSSVKSLFKYPSLNILYLR